MISTKEDRIILYFDHSFIQAFPADLEDPWTRPIRHQMDSMVMQFPLAWSLGKFVATKVPHSWKDLHNPKHDANTAELAERLDKRYYGVAFLTIGNAVINEKTHECFIIKNVFHDEWDPSPLPQEGETPQTYHLRLAKIVDGWKKAKKPKKKGHIQIRPVSTLVLEKIVVDDWSPTLNIQGHLELKEEHVDVR